MSIDVFSRWFHVWFAAVVIGGAVFQWLAMLPAIGLLTDEQRAVLRERMNSRWGKIVALSSAVLIVTGFYNYLVVTRPAHKGDGLYHALMGGKILIAFLVMFLAAALSGRSAKFDGLRRRAFVMLPALIALQLVIVGIASYLKVERPGKPAVETATPPASAT